MKRKIILVFFITALSLFFPRPSLAEETRKFGIGIRASYYDIDTGIVVGRDPKIDSSGLYGAISPIFQMRYFLWS